VRSLMTARRVIRPALVLALLAGAGTAARADETGAEAAGAAFAGLGTPVHAATELDAVRAFGDEDGDVLTGDAVGLLQELDRALEISSGGIAQHATNPVLNPREAGGIVDQVIPRVTTRSRSF